MISARPADPVVGSYLAGTVILAATALLLVLPGRCGPYSGAVTMGLMAAGAFGVMAWLALVIISVVQDRRRGLWALMSLPLLVPYLGVLAFGLLMADYYESVRQGAF